MTPGEKSALALRIEGIKPTRISEEPPDHFRKVYAALLPPESCVLLTLTIMHLPTFLSLVTANIVLASTEWPIPIPESLLLTHHDQHVFDTHTFKPENVRLIQTVEGRYQWTGDIEKLLREGVKLMDVYSL